MPCWRSADEWQIATSLTRTIAKFSSRVQDVAKASKNGNVYTKTLVGHLDGDLDLGLTNHAVMNPAVHTLTEPPTLTPHARQFDRLPSGPEMSRMCVRLIVFLTPITPSTPPEALRRSRLGQRTLNQNTYQRVLRRIYNPNYQSPQLPISTSDHSQSSLHRLYAEVRRENGQAHAGADARQHIWFIWYDLSPQSFNDVQSDMQHYWGVVSSRNVSIQLF